MGNISVITIICFISIVVYFGLLIKTMYLGSVMGRKRGIFIYSLATILIILITGVSIYTEFEMLGYTYYTNINGNNEPGMIPTKLETTFKNNNKDEYIDDNGNGLIKGNTSKKTGEKIYHVPGSTYYDRTKIEDTEMWFKTEEEAKAAGYRAPKN